MSFEDMELNLERAGATAGGLRAHNQETKHAVEALQADEMNGGVTSGSGPTAGSSAATEPGEHELRRREEWQQLGEPEGDWGGWASL